MNIEQAKKIARENGGTLIGFHSVPLPVYQVLLDYDTIDDDPFFPIRKAILQYVDKLAHIEKEKGKQWSLNYMAAMLGLDVSLIKEVYNSLMEEEHLIYRSSEDELLKVTPSARKAYLTEGSRPNKTLTGSILVDGKSFELFSKEIYESISNSDGIGVSARTSNVTSHLPIDLSQKDSSPETLKLISDLNSHQRTPKSIGLEHSEGNNFKITGLEKKFLYGVYLVYIQTKDGSLKKIPYVGHTSMKSASLSNVNTYMFSLKADQKNEKKIIVTANLGYNTNEDCKNKSVEGTEEHWTTLVADIYEVPEEYAQDAIKTDEHGNKYIHVDENLLMHSSNPSRLLDDVLQQTPHKCIPLSRGKHKETGFLIIKLGFDNNMLPYMEIKKAINDKGDILQLKERLTQIDAEKWRQRLVTIGQYSVLEEIDCLQYIYPLQ